MSGEHPVDPADDDAYRNLFRPEPANPDAESPQASPEPEPLSTSSPATEPKGSTDTGRLFRSARVDDETVAVAAIPRDQASRLRTLAASDQPAPIRVTTSEPTPAAVLLGTDSDIAPTPREESTPMPRPRPTAGLRPIGVYGITILATLIAGAIDIVIGGPGLGWFTGIVFTAASVFCALRVRLADAAVAVIAPPIAFFIGAITVGQVGQGATGGLLDRFVTVFFMLASNWIWIIGATLVALVIVIVRGRRGA